jgi:signal transduction histidine kinase
MINNKTNQNYFAGIPASLVIKTTIILLGAVVLSWLATYSALNTETIYIILAIISGLCTATILHYGYTQGLKKQLNLIQQKYKQAKHDLESPLSALKIGTEISKASHLSADRVALIRLAAKRVQDILINLKTNECTSPSVLEPISYATLLHSLKPLLAETKINHTSKDIDFKIRSMQCAPQYRVNLNLSDFTRVISNLLNNAVQAIHQQGEVSLTLKLHGNQLQILVEDNGKGIPRRLIKKVTKNGFSYKNKKGKGLGLHHAKNVVEEIGGEFSITSEFNIGTCILIELPFM